ncbi:MAG: hypothetical protein OXC41_01880 [Gammaproteobacteria bacterium]|nr:hypothetical protein [Gammaproteobacteria bacterium]
MTLGLVRGQELGLAPDTGAGLVRRLAKVQAVDAGDQGNVLALLPELSGFFLLRLAMPARKSARRRGPSGARNASSHRCRISQVLDLQINAPRRGGRVSQGSHIFASRNVERTVSAGSPLAEITPPMV